MSAARLDMCDDLIQYGWTPTKDSDPTLRSRYEATLPIPSTTKIPFQVFESDGKLIRSHKPVILNITYEDNQFFISNESLNVFASGDDIETAIYGFSHHIVYFYEFYSSKKPEECSGLASNLKRLYDQFVKAN
jgi:hypothetical protein